MSPELSQILIRNVPVGLIEDIKNIIYLVTDDVGMKFRGAASFGFNETIPDDKDSYVDVLCFFYIDENIQYAFETFLQRYIDDKCKKIRELNAIYNQGNEK